MDTNNLVEIYLSSIWQYHAAGVERVFEALRKKNPGGQYTFDPDLSWFKVSCRATDVRHVQAIFREVHDEMEHSLGGQRVPTNNMWLKLPTPGDLPIDPVEKAVIDQLCPVTFDRFNFRKVWSRVKNEMPDSISVHKVLDEEARQSIMALSGAHVAIDTTTARLVYIGGATRDEVAKANKLLDNLFNKFIFIMPSPKHLLYAESEGPYHVDARFMAHVNGNMLTSTIFDPSQFPEAMLNRMFKTVFAKGVCLRICTFDHVKRTEVSLFGPRSPQIFTDQARKWPLWFKKAEYRPKILGVTAPKKGLVEKAVQKPPTVLPSAETVSYGKVPTLFENDKTNEHLKENEANKVPAPSEQFDLLGLDIPDPKAVSASGTSHSLVSLPASSPSSEPDSSCENSNGKSVPPVQPPPMPSSFQSDKHTYQMKLLWDFMNSSKNGYGESVPKITSKFDEQAKIANGDNGDHSVKSTVNLGPTDGPIEEEPLIDFVDKTKLPPSLSAVDPVTSTSGQTNLLIQLDPPAPRDTSSSASLQNQLVPFGQGNVRPIVPRATSVLSKALVRRTTFATGLCTSIGRLMADLPYAKGRIRLQVELGRVYIMDASPEGLAFNLPGEAASGWPHTEIVTRLDTICVSPESIVFTKALTLFGNDMESIIGVNQNTVFGDQSADDTTHLPKIEPENKIETNGGSAPMNLDWNFHEKRIVYEFKCQRVYMNSNNVIKALSPFVIEIDGTEPGLFTYAIRSVEDTRPPIWIHCIRRHWDARVSVSYSKIDKLEEEYGDFARALLHTLVVPPSPITSPKFQFAYDLREVKTDSQSYSTAVLSARVRNVGRFQSADLQTFLDISWNWLMALTKRPGNEGSSVGTAYATPAVDDPQRGVFTTWYEASVVSAAAEAAFQENETLPLGCVAAWGSGGSTAREEMYEAAFGPALKLVQKMDGVGVLIDNGQGDKQWAPPVKASQVALAVQKFW
ncbi:uncharacterized protein SPSK_08427 [Sporothrix schenckii 1099-18]|uniref:Uncharacterized protein n=1 Tax=Sporothrix schenckii 1099-18 TaxID=1397361 RepID=A0A0F2M7D8_SPOSC|nr:uncharacterized protein SPSK_08427 [Sporothrix schenckii 1099-18]KJR84091.1 hypothetical protein SPSK_08427 [Sporothrix schenckii 1099-18]